MMNPPIPTHENDFWGTPVIALRRIFLLHQFLFLLLWLLPVLGLTAPPFPAAAAEEQTLAKEKRQPVALEKPAPEDLEDLKAIQVQVQEVIKKVLPCTVAVRVGGASGSGVIVRADGYVLTAGHVSGQPDREVTLIFSDGRRVKAKTLGANHGPDSGLLKITEEGNWPFAEMGRSADLKPGQWCVAVGHPGGYKSGRTPVVRLGRVLDVTNQFIQTDCALVGGDSGGPLFDMQGRVIGTHSRIGELLTQNLHVPVDTYRDTWDRLAKAEVWGSRRGGRRGAASLGMKIDEESKDCRVKELTPGAPADKAGFKVGDVITQLDGQKISNSEDLAAQLRRKWPGDEVMVQVLRGEEVVSLKLAIRRWQGPPPPPPGGQ
jgi:serine protease Do